MFHGFANLGILSKSVQIATYILHYLAYYLYAIWQSKKLMYCCRLYRRSLWRQVWAPTNDGDTRPEVSG